RTPAWRRTWTGSTTCQACWTPPSQSGGTREETVSAPPRGAARSASRGGLRPARLVPGLAARARPGEARLPGLQRRGPPGGGRVRARLLPGADLGAQLPAYTQPHA